MKRLLLALPIALTACTPVGINGILPKGSGEVKGTFSDLKDVDIASNDFDGHGVEVDTSPSYVSVYSKDIGFQGPWARDRFLTITIYGGKPVAGTTYPLLDGTGDQAVATSAQSALVRFEEVQPLTASGFKSSVWFSTGGSLKVEDVSGATVTFSLQNATMVGGHQTGYTPPAGTFTLNVSGHATASAPF